MIGKSGKVTIADIGPPQRTNIHPDSGAPYIAGRSLVSCYVCSESSLARNHVPHYLLTLCLTHITYRLSIVRGVLGSLLYCWPVFILPWCDKPALAGYLVVAFCGWKRFSMSTNLICQTPCYISNQIQSPGDTSRNQKKVLTERERSGGITHRSRPVWHNVLLYSKTWWQSRSWNEPLKLRLIRDLVLSLRLALEGGMESQTRLETVSSKFQHMRNRRWVKL